MLKICGATNGDEVGAVADGGGTHVGLWWGMGGVDRELDGPTLAHLAAVAGRAGVVPVLVTLSGDADAITRAAAMAGIDWVQLHAFQGPRLVAELRDRLGGEATLLKALHVEPDGTSLDLRLASAYRKAGADAFLLDSIRGGRVGSTGAAVPVEALRGAAARVDHRFVLAGGLDDRPTLGQLDCVDWPGFSGIDVDTAARGADGTIQAARVSAIASAWPLASDIKGDRS